MKLGHLGLVIALSALQLAACSATDSGKRPGNPSDQPGVDASTPTSTTDSSFPPGDDGSGDNLVKIEIEPADPVIEIINGAVPAPIVFTAKGITRGGAKVDVTGAWSFDRYDAAAIDSAKGSLKATGLVGAVGVVTLDVGGLEGTTTATIKLGITSNEAHVDAATKEKFGKATKEDAALKLLYPYDQTVFPRGLTGPVMQWEGGTATDVFYVHAKSPTFEFEGWSNAAPPSRYAFPTTSFDVWRMLTDSTVGDISVEVQRYDGTEAYLPEKLTWKIAPANLAGTIYFWEVNTGNVMRIEPGATAPEAFLQAQPDTVEGGQCIACHSVSKDGTRLVGATRGGYSPWQTFNTKDGALLFATQTPNMPATGVSSGFQAISPNGSHVLAGQAQQQPYLTLTAFDGITSLAQLNPGVGFPVQPAWAGDPTKVAFAVRTDGNWLDYNNSTLWIADVDLTTPAFENAKMIVANDVTWPTVSFPTFSPDSKWIAFSRGTQARSRNGRANIWLTNLDGSIQLPLDNTNGVGVLTGDQAASTYEPTFNPVSLGGYFWLVVVSERVYGNTLTGTNAAVEYNGMNARRKQLWVSAIDSHPEDGKDPSHPAFWLPGQGLDNNNMRGEWALSPCKKLGDSCSAGFDCCAGFCRADDQGKPVCSEPPTGCAQVGEACDTKADCCDDSALCTAGYCSLDGPQ